MLLLPKLTSALICSLWTIINSHHGIEPQSFKPFSILSLLFFQSSLLNLLSQKLNRNGSLDQAILYMKTRNLRTWILRFGNKLYSFSVSKQALEYQAHCF